MRTYAPAAESPFSEVEEQELASELLAVNSGQELDQFLGGLLHRAASAVGGALRSPLGHALERLAKGAVRQILPSVGGGLNALFDSRATGQIGQLAAGAGRVLGLEGEGLSAEDQEFAAATQLVRLAGAAAGQAAASPSTGTPEEVARQAMIQAARLHAPGLVRPASSHPHSCGCGGGSCSCQIATAGSWERRGRHIILHGV
jgi:hypothetical protein